MLWFACAALAGLSAGALAGLLGIGGGLVLVPALYWLLPQAGVSSEHLAQMVLGTSFALIIPGALSSVLSHQRRGAIVWTWVRQLSPLLLLAALSGSLLARWVPGMWLAALFSVFLLGVAASLWREPASDQALRPIAPGVLALVTGWLSSWLGIAGGTLLVPGLNRLGLSLRQSVATSSACGLPLALVAALGYAGSGWTLTQTMPGFIGFIFWPAVLATGLFSMIGAPLGAWLAHRLPVALLRRIFSVILLLTALKMLISLLG